LTCRKCGISKPANTEYFGAQADCRYGLKKICKVCDYTLNQKPWAIAHREIIKERTNSRYYPSRKSYFTSRYEVERERILADQHAFKEEHPEIVSANKMRYQQSERGKARHVASEHNRRARKLSTGGSYTSQEIEAQYKRQKSKCYYCHKKMIKSHIEHVVPVTRGGSNDISNIVLACPTCNRSKGAKLLHEWPEGGRLL